MKPVRAKVDDAGIQPIGKFALFRHRKGERQAKFVCLHETSESAMGEAERLTAEYIAGNPAIAIVFYAVEIVGRVGLIDGRLKSERG